jgi:hypothetical protein
MRALLILTAWLVCILGVLTPAAAQGPTLTVTAPQQGAVINDTTVTVQFQVNGLTMVPSSVPLAEAGKRPEANRPGEGHLHLMLDLQPVVVWDRNEPYTFQDVPPGEHHLMVEVANNDHSSLSPPVVQHIRFRIAGPETMPNTGSAAAGQPQYWSMLLVLGAVTLLATGLGLRRRVA